MQASSVDDEGLQHSNFTSSYGIPRHILWVRTDSIGDAILAASMLPHLRSAYSDTRITVACQQVVSELYESCPYIDDILAFDKARAYQDEAYRNGLLERLKEKGIDAAVNSTYSREPIADLLIVGSGAPSRIGFDGDTCSMQEAVKVHLNLFYTRLFSGESGPKAELDRHKEFLRGLGIQVVTLGPIMWLTPEDEAFADQFFHEKGLLPEQTIAFFAGTQTAARQYDRYGDALSRICRENRFTVIALGGSGERQINQRNLDAIQVPGVNLSGKTSLRQAAAILKRCRLAVGAETGLAHMACAVETPNVILLGGGHFGRFMPYSPLTSVVCLPLDCFGCDWHCKYSAPHCIQDVLPSVIHKAVISALNLPMDRPRIFEQGKSMWDPPGAHPPWQACDHLLAQPHAAVIVVEEAQAKDESAHAL